MKHNLLRAVLFGSSLWMACASAPDWTTHEVALDLAAPSSRVAPVAVTIAPTIDARLMSGTRDRRPHIESRYSVLVGGPSGGMFIDGARVEGLTCHAGERLVLRDKAASLAPRELVDRLVRGRVEGRPGQEVALGQVEEVVTRVGAGDGLVIVPILDQLDMCRLSSVSSMSGGSSSATPSGIDRATVTTTSGAATFGAETARWANVRLRLLVAEVGAGKVRASHWYYVRGSGAVGWFDTKADPMRAAIDDASRALDRALDQIVSRPMDTEVQP